MNTSDIILYFSVILWLVPPFKQWRTDYKYLFLVLALADPLRLGVFYTFGSWPGFLTAPLVIVQLASLYFIRKIKLHTWFIIIGCTIASGFIKNNIVTDVILNLCNIIVFLVLFLRFADDLVSRNILNLYLMAIIAYQLSNILKFISAILDLNTGVYYFNITTIFQILFGLFFSLVSHWQIKIETGMDQYNSKLKR